MEPSIIWEDWPRIAWADLLMVLFPTLAIIAITTATRRKAYIESTSIRSPEELGAESTTGHLPTEYEAQLDSQLARMQLHKELYFKLQHLEQYPEILPQGRDVLISLFSETLARESKAPGVGILSISQYSRERLLEFQRNADEVALGQWEQYVARRRAGAPREMLRNKEEARWWLTQSAPIKYIDGAWLGHINKITTPFALRRVVKNAWQVLSEELGDGDLEKNHVYIYRQLMKVAEPGLPPGDATDFIHPRHQLNEPGIWKAAVAQLLISVFPHQFLPEILGFNMHFEAIALETLIVSRELKELEFDPYYFILHISIDNAHSGHTAMAVEAVAGYIELIRRTEGDAAAQQAWVRVQAGYVLSKGLPTAPVCASLKTATVPRALSPLSAIEGEVVKIFQAKAEVAHKIHCGSRLKIGSHTLAQWLEPGMLMSPQMQMSFLTNFGNTKPWIYKGDSKRSRFIKELSWRGKMFGSFTPTEVQVIEQWINSMGEADTKLYWRFINNSAIPSNQALHDQDIRVHHPVIQPLPPNSLLAQQPPLTYPLPPLESTSIDATGILNLPKLLPLWFTHPCLLEHFICIPAKTTTLIASSVIRVLRAQSGFGPEGPIVAGMDAVCQDQRIGLVELGLQMVQTSGFAEPRSLKEVLDTWESEFGLLMLHLCKRPIEHASLLLGLAMAFVDLHDTVAQSPTLLSEPGSRRVLAEIARRERESLNICLVDVRATQPQFADFHRGYYLGREQIEKCFK